MSDFNYSTVLTRCMLVSAIALALGVAFPAIPRVAAFAGALLPLIWYHTMFLRPRTAEGLPQPAIDSVYYYGFLITIGALGATALDLSLHGIDDNFAPVAFQFGLGLLATGYAVWARVELTASTKILDEEELRSLMSRQVAQSRELLGNVELASSSFESYATALMQRSEQFAADAEARTRASIDAAIKAFSDGIAAMSEQAQTALNDLRGIVNDVTFGAEREALRTSVSAMVETVASLSEGLDRLKASSSAGAGSVGEFAGSLERVNVAAAATGGRLDPLGRADGSIARFDQALASSSERANEFFASSGGASYAMDAFAGAGTAGRQAMELLSRKAASTAGKMDALATAVDVAVSSADKLHQAAGGLTEFEASAGGVTVRLLELQDQVTALRSTAGDLDAVLAGSTERLKTTADRNASAIEEAAERLSAAIGRAEARLVDNSATTAGAAQVHGAADATSTL